MSQRKQYKTHLDDENCAISRTSSWRKRKKLESTNENNSTLDEPSSFTRDEEKLEDEVASMSLSEMEKSSESESEEQCHEIEADDDCYNWSDIIFGEEEYNEDNPHEYNYQQYLEEESELVTPTSNLDKKIQSERFFQPLKKSIPLSEGEILMMVIKYSLRFNLTHTAVTNLIKMLNCFFPRPLLPDTRYLVDKIFFPKDIATYHSICPNCETYAGKYSHECIEKVCEVCNHKIQLRDSNYVSFYVTFSLSKEIKSVLECNDGYYDFVINERQHDNGVYEDIYDGQAYRKFVKNLSPQDKNNFCTLIFNSDGAPVFNSSSYSIWPLQVIVNETPIQVRTSKSIVYGLWFGKGKPDMEVFLQSFVDDVNHLSNNGIPCTIRGEERIIKPFAVCCCVDTIARAPMQGMHQFNKYGACNWCKHPGKWIPNKQNTGGSVKYPLLKSLPEDKTEEEMILSMSQLVNDDKPLYAINGVSPLINLQHFNIIDGFTPDDMHFARLGVAKQFTDYWCSFKNSSLSKTLNSTKMYEIDNI
ncbi:uncharacterized protein LOC127284280 [Leptopilina boulardi]|uniref:uncharacterized protein LOC127284280 n=1 Tax=Leptopilina boulardi TaxID=63433 RepID=UPI0021F5B708|nr:uncharacterized protein LOC127284280 [Leptopilina boulardi]